MTIKSAQRVGTAVAFALGLLAIAMPASASLIGDEIDITFSSTDDTVNGTQSLTLNNVLVGAGIEATADFLGDLQLIPGGAEPIDIDVSSGAISIAFVETEYSSNSGFLTNMRFLFENLDWLPLPGVILGATVNETLLRFDVAVMTTANSVQVDLTRAAAADTLSTIDGTILVDLQTTHIDEPAALGIFAIGLLGLALTRRRKRATTPEAAAA